MDDAYSNSPENEMIGVWRLISSEFRTSKGDVVYPLGENAQGQLILTRNGFMSGQLMRPERPRFSGPDLSTGTIEEIKNAFEGFVSYYGPYEIDTKNRKLITHVEGSLYPNWVGDDQIRFFELSDGRLILKTLPIRLGEEEFIGVLVWELKTKGAGHV
jgi:hypothetical protein